MKTKEQVQKDLDLELQDFKLIEKEASTRVRNKVIANLDWFRQAIMYLDTNPTEDFVKKQLQDCINERDAINGHEKFFHSKKIESERRTEYKNKSGLDVIENQIKFLTYLLA